MTSFIGHVYVNHINFVNIQYIFTIVKKYSITDCMYLIRKKIHLLIRMKYYVYFIIKYKNIVILNFKNNHNIFFRTKEDEIVIGVDIIGIVLSKND